MTTFHCPNCDARVILKKGEEPDTIYLKRLERLREQARRLGDNQEINKLQDEINQINREIKMNAVKTKDAVMECMECGRKFRKEIKPSTEVKCPNCGGYDVDFLSEDSGYDPTKPKNILKAKLLAKAQGKAASDEEGYDPLDPGNIAKEKELAKARGIAAADMKDESKYFVRYIWNGTEKGETLYGSQLAKYGNNPSEAVKKFIEEKWSPAVKISSVTLLSGDSKIKDSLFKGQKVTAIKSEQGLREGEVYTVLGEETIIKQIVGENNTTVYKLQDSSGNVIVVENPDGLFYEVKDSLVPVRQNMSSKEVEYKVGGQWKPIEGKVKIAYENEQIKYDRADGGYHYYTCEVKDVEPEGKKDLPEEENEPFKVKIGDIRKNMDAARKMGFDTAPYQKEIDKLEVKDDEGQVVISNKEMSKYNRLKEKGYKTVWVGEGKICMALPNKIKDEKFPVGSYVRVNIMGSKPEKVIRRDGTTVWTNKSTYHETKVVAVNDSKVKDGEDQLIGNYEGYKIVFNGGFIKAQEDGFTKIEFPSSMGAGGWSRADVQKMFQKIDMKKSGKDSKVKDESITYKGFKIVLTESDDEWRYAVYQGTKKLADGTDFDKQSAKISAEDEIDSFLSKDAKTKDEIINYNGVEIIHSPHLGYYYVTIQSKFGNGEYAGPGFKSLSEAKEYIDKNRVKGAKDPRTKDSFTGIESIKIELKEAEADLARAKEKGDVNWIREASGYVAELKNELKNWHKYNDSSDFYTKDPLTEKGKKILAAMKKAYGEEKGEQIFYASKNKGTISGVDKKTKDFDERREYLKELEKKKMQLEKEGKWKEVSNIKREIENIQNEIYGDSKTKDLKSKGINLADVNDSKMKDATAVCRECGKSYNPDKSDVHDPDEVDKFCSSQCEAAYKSGGAEHRISKDNYRETLQKLRDQLEKAKQEGDTNKVRDLEIEIKDFIKETADANGLIGAKVSYGSTKGTITGILGGYSGNIVEVTWENGEKAKLNANILKLEPVNTKYKAEQDADYKVRECPNCKNQLTYAGEENGKTKYECGLCGKKYVSKDSKIKDNKYAKLREVNEKWKRKRDELKNKYKQMGFDPDDVRNDPRSVGKLHQEFNKEFGQLNQSWRNEANAIKDFNIDKETGECFNYNMKDDYKRIKLADLLKKAKEGYFELQSDPKPRNHIEIKYPNGKKEWVFVEDQEIKIIIGEDPVNPSPAEQKVENNDVIYKEYTLKQLPETGEFEIYAPGGSIVGHAKALELAKLFVDRIVASKVE